jgi:hypothetical protein
MGGQGGAGGSQGTDILDELQGVEGASVVEQPSEIDGYRFFLIEFDQPADHEDPAGLRFKQRLALHHRDPSAPLVLASTGYTLDLPAQILTEPTALLKANQLVVEHRFFTPSRPEPANWSLLTIEQAANDDHRVVQAFRPIYTAAWISTGLRKGGMAAVYHRRFFPDDVDGTVAYGAPHTLGLGDPRYITFIDQVGDDACRQALRDFQREVLIRRTEMLVRMADQATMLGLTYNLWGMDASLESVVLGFAFSFWQNFGIDRCIDIPTIAATDDEVWAFFAEIGDPPSSADDAILKYEPYYWQASTQLGTPGVAFNHLVDLLETDWTMIDSYPSIAGNPVFDPAAMTDISDWLGAEGQRFLFVYGEMDPWSAAPFELGAAMDSYRFIAPGANHHAQISDLAQPDLDQAFAALGAWSGVMPGAKVGAARAKSPPMPALLLRQLPLR